MKPALKVNLFMVNSY